MPVSADRRADFGEPTVVWLTGLSGAGKTTLAHAARSALDETGRAAVVLDGDSLRGGLNSDLGFTLEDRREAVRRAAEVATLMAGLVPFVFVAMISPLKAHRALARELCAGCRFVEVYVSTPLSVAERRDPKGLYRMARAGRLKDFTGVDAPYEAPEGGATLDTSDQTLETSVERLLQLLAIPDQAAVVDDAI